ncbi:unnamed protein product [Fusarium graminearum]|nr:unnamed protein product [Fusarium graminearum]
MWLLDAHSLGLVFFANEEQTPPYAILSHTWSNGEVLFQDIKAIPTGNDVATKAGWSKIEHACRLALSFGLRYVWVDTCCIDKSSSAELQEAINSMFRWYEVAQICFAYLSDVSASDDHTVKGSSFRRSRWFKRGWTLQELIAPIEVAFYDKYWKPIFTRGNKADLIEAVTGIGKCYLSNGYQDRDIRNILSTASVAERMAWMDKRKTTRPEDLAYCLLGIFDINMPMLYGEGSKAFWRLQYEIMKKSDDSSLLIWGYQELYEDWRFEEGSLLAPHPSSFRHCGDIEPCPLEGFNTPSFLMSQRGIQMEVPIRIDLTHKFLVYMILGCSPRVETGSYLEQRPPKSFVAIPLISTSALSIFKQGQGTRKGEYLRPKWCRPVLVSKEFISQANTISIVIRHPSERLGEFEELPISIAPSPVPITQGYTILGTYPPQPIGSGLVLIQADSSQHIPDIPPPPTLQKKFPDPLSMLYSKEHETMIQISIPKLGIFLVVLGYRAVAWGMIGGWNIWQCLDIKCRAFKSPDNIHLEALQTLSITQDYNHLPEISSIFRVDRYIINIGAETDMYLVIRLSNKEMLTRMTDIHMSVTYQLDIFHEQEVSLKQGENKSNMPYPVPEIKRSDHFHTKVSPKLLNCVKEQLEKDFPKNSTA